ncbi:hypothetical protein Leryth_024641 [Lithospermum erythrorhizon]|nr:hypothetical protein Leryth_024641 [Lithospermum erythrorhizon]
MRPSIVIVAISNGFGYGCETCNFNLHVTCAALPDARDYAIHLLLRNAFKKHKHPILLRYPPHGKHPDHFMCDMCEELINPKYWLYSCFECDVGFHTECAPR